MWGLGRPWPSARLQRRTSRALPVAQRLSGAPVDEVHAPACQTRDRFVGVGGLGESGVVERRYGQADLHVRSRLGAAKNKSFHRLIMTNPGADALICLNRICLNRRRSEPTEPDASANSHAHTQMSRRK